MIYKHYNCNFEKYIQFSQVGYCFFLPENVTDTNILCQFYYFELFWFSQLLNGHSVYIIEESSSPFIIIST